MDCKQTCQLHNQTCPPKAPSCSEVPELLQALGPSSLAAGQQAISSQTKGACTMAAWVLRRPSTCGCCMCCSFSLFIFWIPQHKFNWGILGDLVWSTGFQRKSKTLGNVGNLAWFAWVKLKIRLALPHTGVVLRREPRISWWGLHGANKALSTQSPPTLYWNCYCFDYLNVFCPNYVLLALSLPLVFSAAWPAQVKRWSSEQSFDGSWG